MTAHKVTGKEKLFYGLKNIETVITSTMTHFDIGRLLKLFTSQTISMQHKNDIAYL